MYFEGKEECTQRYSRTEMDRKLVYSWKKKCPIVRQCRDTPGRQVHATVNIKYLLEEQQALHAARRVELRAHRGIADGMRHVSDIVRVGNTKTGA